MRPARRWFSFVVLALVLFTVCIVEAASATTNTEENPAETPAGTVFRWLNFFLVFGGAGYLIAKKGPAIFRRRAEAISASIAEAAAAKAAAEQQFREAEERLRRLDQDVAKLRAAAERESAVEAKRIRVLAGEEVEKIRRAARAEIEAAERAAWMELKAIATRLAIERAGALIQQQITPATQTSLFGSFLQSLSRSAN